MANFELLYRRARFGFYTLPSSLSLSWFQCSVTASWTTHLLRPQPSPGQDGLSLIAFPNFLLRNISINLNRPASDRQPRDIFPIHKPGPPDAHPSSSPQVLSSRNAIILPLKCFS